MATEARMFGLAIFFDRLCGYWGTAMLAAFIELNFPKKIRRKRRDESVDDPRWIGLYFRNHGLRGGHTFNSASDGNRNAGR